MSIYKSCVLCKTWLHPFFDYFDGIPRIFTGCRFCKFKYIFDFNSGELIYFLQDKQYTKKQFENYMKLKTFW